MKKLLIATTALVMTAGMAAAEVKLSGDARMGVVYSGGTDTADNEWNFSSRARVTFTMSGTTDSGLEFGAEFQADDADSESYRWVDTNEDGVQDAGEFVTVNGAEDGTSGTVYISGAFGKIEMGDVVSAPEALFSDFYEVGYTDIASRNGSASGLTLDNDIPYLTLDNNTQSGLLYTYSAGAFSVAASMDDGKNGITDADQTMAVAAAYTFGNYMVGLGYEAVNASTTSTVGDRDQLELAGVAKFGATNVKAYYADRDFDIGTANDGKAYGIGVDTKFGATTVGGYVQTFDSKTNSLDVTWYGIGASYDLGGGAAIKGGIADNDLPNTDMVADLGVTFSF